MCGPAVVPIVMIAATALTAYGAVQQAQAGEAAAEASDAQDKENAKIADASAREAVLTGQVEEDRRRQQTRAMLGAQRAAFAANNVDMSLGTPAEILGDTAAVGEEDALTIRANAARKAWGYQVESNNYRNQGRMGLAAARNNKNATYLTTAGSVLQSGASIYGNMSRTPSTGATGDTAFGYRSY